MKEKAAREVSFAELCIEERRAKLSDHFLYKIKANVARTTGTSQRKCPLFTTNFISRLPFYHSKGFRCSILCREA